MKKIILVVVLSVAANFATAGTTMVCQTASGAQFVYVGNVCPIGSFFVSY